MQHSAHSLTRLMRASSVIFTQRASLASSQVSRAAFQASALLHHMNYGAKQHRPKTRSFQERMESKIRKPKSERKAKENQLEDAKQFVDVELPDTLADVVDPVLKRCDDLLLGLANMPSLLEKFKIEVDGKERPLYQLGSFTRDSATELHYSPMMPGIANQIIHKLAKLDRDLNAVRLADGKIRIAIPRMTTKRREGVVYEMELLASHTIPKLHEKRKFALRQIKDIAPNLDHQNEMILTSEADEKLKNAEVDFKSKVEDKVYDARNMTINTEFENEEHPIDAP